MANSRLPPRLANLTLPRLLGTHGTGGWLLGKGVKRCYKLNVVVVAGAGAAAAA